MTPKEPYITDSVKHPPGSAALIEDEAGIKVGEAKVVKAKDPLPDLAKHIAKTYQSRSYPVTRPRKLMCTPLTKEDRFKFRRPLSAILSEEADDSDALPPAEPLTPRRRDALSGLNHIFAATPSKSTTDHEEPERFITIPPLPSHNTFFNQRCPMCGETMHTLKEDDVSWGILCLEALIRRHPGLATPLLLDILDAAVW